MVPVGHMDAVMFIGIPGAGKSSFYGARFAHSHLRLSLDMLRTRHRLMRLLDACIETTTAFVLDNTNVSQRERQPFIVRARAANYRVRGFFFESKIDPCLQRNLQRPPDQQVPVAGVRGRRNALELPTLNEGFDELSFVRIDADGTFEVSSWAL